MSLHFIPTPYPDELWYSVLCRYHARSGNIAVKHSCIDIFGYPKQKVSIELASDLQCVLAGMPTSTLTPSTVIQHHTLLPYYARFWRPERKAAVIADFINGNVESAVHKVGIYQSISGSLKVFRYCPQCYQEDIVLYGEPYWHRLHQLSDLVICVKHKCWLAATDISMRDNKQMLSPAPLDMLLSIPSQVPPTQQELALSLLHAENLINQLDMGNGRIYVDVFDMELKRRGWRSPTGKRTDAKKMSKVMRDFYGEFIPNEDIDHKRLNSTFAASKSPAPRYILQAAFFFGIDLDTLLRAPETDDAVSEIYRLHADGVSQREIARLTGVDSSTVRRWLNKRLRHNT